MLSRIFISIHDEFGCAAQGVFAQFHGRRARVAGPSGKFDVGAGLTRDASDHADRQIFLFQHRALFNVNFDIAEQILRSHLAGFDSGRVAAELPNRIGHCDAVGVHHGQFRFIHVSG